MESPSMKKRWLLVGATALVTRGISGIGFAIVEELVLFGASVHTCTENGAHLDICMQRSKSLNHPVTGSICDVASGAQRENMMAEFNAACYSMKLQVAGQQVMN